jgi:hypothetical protein
MKSRDLDRKFTPDIARARWGGVLEPPSTLSPLRAIVCGAKTRKGQPCQAKAIPGKMRCKFHGGASTRPRTDDGKARIAEAQRRRWAAHKASKKKTQKLVSTETQAIKNCCE